jgi:hypothetical protein
MARMPLPHYNRKSPVQGGPEVSRDKEAAPAVSPREELVLKVAKEIVVKFIEVGRLSPASFPETFKMVLDSVRQSLKP